jgi:hypothetical protein
VPLQSSSKIDHQLAHHQRRLAPTWVIGTFQGFVPYRDIISSYPLAGLAPIVAGDPAPAVFRPRRFTRPRRLAPTRDLWVCFTPLPRLGLHLQGFCLTKSCTDSSPAAALMSLDSHACRILKNHSYP